MTIRLAVFSKENSYHCVRVVYCLYELYIYRLYVVICRLYYRIEVYVKQVPA